MYHNNDSWVQLEDVYLEIRKLQALVFFLDNHFSHSENYSTTAMYGFHDALDKLDNLVSDVDWLISANRSMTQEQDDGWEQMELWPEWKEWEGDDTYASFGDDNGQVEQSVQDRLGAQVGREVF